MYIYGEIGQALVDERVAQFRDQTRRFLARKLSEDNFRPLRLQNGLYIQKHAPMLRVAIPYGMLASRQLRKLSEIASKYDRGFDTFELKDGESVADALAGFGDFTEAYQAAADRGPLFRPRRQLSALSALSASSAR